MTAEDRAFIKTMAFAVVLVSWIISLVITGVDDDDLAFYIILFAPLVAALFCALFTLVYDVQLNREYQRDEKRP